MVTDEVSAHGQLYSKIIKFFGVIKPALLKKSAIKFKKKSLRNFIATVSLRTTVLTL